MEFSNGRIKVTVEWEIEPNEYVCSQKAVRLPGARIGLTTFMEPEVFTQEHFRKYWIGRCIQKMVEANHERWFRQATWRRL